MGFRWIVIALSLGFALGSPPALASEVSESDEDLTETTSPLKSISAHYFGIFYGPSLENFSVYQPTPEGDNDPEHPIVLQNFLSVGYSFTDEVSLAATGFWTVEPVGEHRVALRDPALRLSHEQLYHTEVVNLYGDVRVRFGVSPYSRDRHVRGSLQTFQNLSFLPPGVQWLTFGVHGLQRATWMGELGSGNDLDLYLGPNLNFRTSDRLSITLLYELYAAHVFGAEAFDFTNDGTDLETSLNWDISPQMSLNPFLRFYPGGKMNLQSTSAGLMFSWQFL